MTLDTLSSLTKSLRIGGRRPGSLQAVSRQLCPMSAEPRRGDHERAVGLRVDGRERVVDLSDGGQVASRAVVLATGVRYRRLAAPSLEAMIGAGVFYGSAASEAQAMKGQEVYVAGGANSAGQAAVHLARYARHVTWSSARMAFSEPASDRFRGGEIGLGPPGHECHPPIDDRLNPSTRAHTDRGAVPPWLSGTKGHPVRPGAAGCGRDGCGRR